MQSEPDKQLERLIHGELQQLPPVPAPDSLIPRVRAAITARQNLPWWQQPWMTWPVAARVVSALLLLSGVGYVGYLVDQWVPGVGRSLDGVGQSLDGWWVWELVVTLGNALLAMVQSLDTTFWLVGAGLLVVTYLSCIGLGTLCFRVAYNKR